MSSGAPSVVLVKRILLGVVAAYLVLGLVAATMFIPQQTYVCPDASAPHGEVTYGGIDDPPRPDCRPTRTSRDVVAALAVGSVVWLPLVVLKGLSNVRENQEVADLEGG